MALTEAQKKQDEKNQKYWADREAEALKHRITDEKEYSKQLSLIYGDMLDAVQEQIDAFLGKYAKKEGISIADAKKAVSKADIAAYERKAKKYVEQARKDRKARRSTKNASYFSKEANEEMALYNLTMKINRLEMLKANIGLELIKGHEELEQFMEGILEGRTMDELARQAGILGKTIRNNAEIAKVIVNASFHNATFSERIWMHQDLLKSDINKLLQQGLIQGKNGRQLAKELEKRFEAKKSDAERLMRTELARVQTDAQKESFERNGFTQYTFIVNSGCCAICQDLNGEHFKVKDMKIGENAPPVHPQCRCSIAAYEDSEDYEAWLDFLDKGGTTEQWNKRLKIGSPGSTKSFKRSLSDIAAGKAGLDKRRQNILRRVDKSGKSYRFERGTITLRDLAYLSAATGNEFALFRSKNEDILVRGDARTCDVSGELGEEILERKYEWVAHSHIDQGNLMPSIDDRETLKKLEQKTSIIIGINGEEKEFSQSPFSD